MTRKIYFIVFVILAAWSIWSLPYSPLPWYDEVVFSSATHSFITGHGLAMEIDNYEPVVMYGPVYFLITGLVTKIFGFGIFTFRITNCIFSFLMIIVLGKIMELLKVKKSVNYLVQVLILTDVLFFSNSHSGRMEFVALFFVVLALFCYLKKNKNNWLQFISISLFLTLAVLTTPRVVVVAIPIAIAGLMKLIQSRNWYQTSVYCLIPILLFVLWIMVAYGSVNEMIDYLTQPTHGFSNTEKKSLLSLFIGGNFNISIFQYPMILAALLSIVFFIKQKRFKEIILYVSPIVLFYLLVVDTGYYGVFVLPFFAILIALGVTGLNTSYNKSVRVCYKGLIAVCLIVNCSILGLKAFTVISNLEQRSPDKFAEWIKHNIPSGCCVAGDYTYYYATIANECQFKRIVRSGVEKEIVLKDVLGHSNPDYIILSPNSMSISELPLFISSGYEQMANLEAKEVSGLIATIQKMTNISFTSSYEGCIYKKVNR